MDHYTKISNFKVEKNFPQKGREYCAAKAECLHFPEAMRNVETDKM